MRAEPRWTQYSRHQLADVARVATIGELTASLAHQLNQPLAAIMTNAQAATRMLGAAPPDLSMLREILRDIVADDLRASNVITRLAALLRKSEPGRDLVDPKAAIHDVMELLSRDAVLRNVTLLMEFGTGSVVVLETACSSSRPC